MAYALQFTLIKAPCATYCLIIEPHHEGGEDMPGQNGTGPQGNGSKSGRGFRKCKRNADPKSDSKKLSGQCQKRQRYRFKQRMEKDQIR